MKNKCKYLVMKLLTEVEVFGQKAKLNGCAGYLPVHDNIKEAKKEAGKKYKIVAINAVNP